MGWPEANKKVDKNIDGQFVACSEDYELDYIKKAIQDEVDEDYSEKEIETAIEECCKDVDAPRPRKDFMKCMRSKLEK